MAVLCRADERRARTSAPLSRHRLPAVLSAGRGLYRGGVAPMALHAGGAAARRALSGRLGVARARDGVRVRCSGAHGVSADGGAGVDRPRHAQRLASRGAGSALGRRAGAGGDRAGSPGHRRGLPVSALRLARGGASGPAGAELAEPAGGGGTGAARRGQPAVSPRPCGPHRARANQRWRAPGPRSLRAARRLDGRTRDPGVYRQRGAARQTPAKRLRGDPGLRRARGPAG